MRIIAGFCGLILFSAPAFAQMGGDRNCAIDGNVVNSVSGAPILRAHISVAAGEETFVVDSDAAGNWIAEHIACGRVTVTVSRVGFLPVAKNQPTSQLVNTPLHDVKLELAPQAVLTGRVLNDQSDPVLGAQVSLMTSRIVDGVRGIQASASMATNDLGEYRFAGLAAGKYAVCVNAGGVVAANGGKAYAEKCYPGPMDGGPPSTLDVAAGYEGEIDFSLLALPTVNVSGVVSGMVGTSVGVRLLPVARTSMWLSAMTRADGTFTIRDVPPGSYTAWATSPGLHARAPLQVGNSDVDELQLQLEPGATVTGTIKVISGSGRSFDKRIFAADLMSRDGGGSPQTVWDPGRMSFTISDVVPGNYRLAFSQALPFYIKSIAFGGQDVPDSDIAVGPDGGNIEVVFSDDGGAVEGDVSADEGSTTAWVLLEKDGMASRNVRTDASGHFKIENVAPGDYTVYAWDDYSNVEYGNPEWMKENGTGVAVTVEPGTTAQVIAIRRTAPPE